MKGQTRNLKQNHILDAAESVFSKVGFKNARMEDIASEANITKVTLYNYFKSKEDLYMAITYKALSELVADYKNCMHKNAGKTGLESTVDLMNLFMDFCEKNYFYSEALLEYFALMRSTSSSEDHTKLTDAIKESSYFQKLKVLHNLPFKYTIMEIQRGQKDHSIRPDIDPVFYTLQGWTVCVGYVKIVSVSGENASPLFNVNLQNLKTFNLDLTRKILGAKT
jgi:AcrR family transcriptional regulator